MDYGNDPKLSLDEAFKTLKSMFKNMDDEVILTVLESNNFLLEPTIDCLLNIQNSSENEKIQTDKLPNNNNAVSLDVDQQAIQQNVIQNNNPVSLPELNQLDNNHNNKEKVLSLFENIDNNYNESNYKHEDNFDPHNLDFETLQAYCLENNIPLNDLDLIKYYMDNPEDLYQIEPNPNQNTSKSAKKEEKKNAVKKPNDTGNKLKNDKLDGFDIRDKTDIMNKIDNKEEKTDEMRKKKKGFGQKFKGKKRANKDWFNDIFSKKKKEEKKKSEYEAISENDENENIKANKK